MEILDDVLKAIRITRDLSLSMHGKIEPKSYKGEHTSQAVTEIDLQVEKALAEAFKEIDPSIGFVGEEYGGNRSLDRFWLVDPIDGTAHYIRGLPFCTTMVALIEHGEVSFSAIYHFVTDELFYAVKGGGAFKNRDSLQVSERPSRDSFLFHEINLHKGNNMDTYLKMDKKNIGLLNTINAGYEFSLVAMGKVEGRICLDPYGSDYDFAPGSLLVKEAGGMVTNIGSNSYDYTNLNFLATNKVIHKELTEGDDALFPTGN